MRKGNFILKRKIFISHASKDKKSYVDILYKKLKTSLIGEDNIIYDSESFGAGEVIADEINKRLGFFTEYGDDVELK